LIDPAPIICTAFDKLEKEMKTCDFDQSKNCTHDKVFHFIIAEVARVTKTKAREFARHLPSHRVIYFRVQKTLPIYIFTFSIFVSMILDLETLKCPFGMRVKLQDTPKKSVFVY
jgi:hypothetical protein